jgi:hypothetical protein
MDKQNAYAGLIATINVTCEQCGHSFTYEQQIVKMATAINRDAAKSKVAEELRNLISPWRKGNFAGIKAKSCPSCKHYQLWMERSRSQRGGSLMRRLRNLLGYKKNSRLVDNDDIYSERRNPTLIKARPIPNDLLIYTDFELSFLFGYKNKEKVIFQSLRHRSLDQVIQILDGRYTDELDTLINELKEIPDVIDGVIRHYIQVLSNTKNCWDWGENSLGEVHRIYPHTNQGDQAAHILSTIGEPATEQLLGLLEDAGNKLESDFTNEIIICLTAEALGRIAPESERIIPAVIKAMEMVEKFPSTEVDRQYNRRNICCVLEKITRVYNLTSYQEWWGWWQINSVGAQEEAGKKSAT